MEIFDLKISIYVIQKWSNKIYKNIKQALVEKKENVKTSCYTRCIKKLIN